MKKNLVKLILTPQLLKCLPSIELSEKAACKEADPELFFSTEPEARQQAKAVCLDCPVMGLCLDYGVKVANRGILGGKTAEERLALAETAPVDAETVNEAIAILRDLVSLPTNEFAEQHKVHIRTVSRYKRLLADGEEAA